MFFKQSNPWVQLVTDPKFGDSAIALREYLLYVDNSESPREYHVWSFLSLASATLRRRCWVSLGAVGSVLPNQYVILVGPPAARKNSAINFTERFHWISGIKLGPGDTAGQRHGLMVSFQGTYRSPNPKRLDGIVKVPKTLEELAAMSAESIHEQLPKTDRASDLYLVSKELSRLITNQDSGMINFLTDVWDGESIDYQTKHGRILIRKPSLNLLGATTPTSLAGSLPRGASDHGILSRIIFVYGSDSYRSLPRPSPLTAKEVEIQTRIEDRLKRITEYQGGFTDNHEAGELYDSLYVYRPKILDSRFNGYGGRRGTHLKKLSLALAALRNDSSQEIIGTDVALAHEILVKTEESMAQALLALGGSQLHLGKYLMIEYLRAEGTGTLEDLYRVAASELKRTDAKAAIDELMAAGVMVTSGVNTFILAEVIHNRPRPQIVKKA